MLLAAALLLLCYTMMLGLLLVRIERSGELSDRSLIL